MQLDNAILKNAVFALDPTNFTRNIWGGSWLERLKGIPVSRARIGESWDFSGRKERPTYVRFPNGSSLALTDLVQKYPNEILGPRIVSRFGPVVPILLKFIDACDNLSVQVHPSNDHAPSEEFGKAEAWYILESGKKAGEGYVYVGFDPKKAAGYASREMFESAFFDALTQAQGYGASDNAKIREKAARLVLPFLNKIRVRAGDTFELPPGTVHAIGRGVRLFEIQQASDLTYRLWDWNRPSAAVGPNGSLQLRELHWKKARAALNFSAEEPENFRPAPERVEAAGKGKFSEKQLLLDREKKFAANLISLSTRTAEYHLKPSGVFQVLTVVKGEIKVGGLVTKAGHSVLIPASSCGAQVRATRAPAYIIRSYVPI